MARYSEKVKLKRSNLEVTRLSLGTAPLGGLFASVSDKDGDELLNRALDLGINYFDTAPQYGHGIAEMRVGKVLRNAKVPFIINFNRDPKTDKLNRLNRKQRANDCIREICRWINNINHI